MPIPKFAKGADDDLFSLDREYFSIALQALHFLAAHPEAGDNVTLQQFYLDETLKPPLKEFIQRTGSGFRLHIYYWPQTDGVWIEKIVLVPMM